MLVLELGKKYKTRSGDFVTIRNFDEGDTKPFFGDIVDANGIHVRVASFGFSGGYSYDGKSSQFDIVNFA